MLAAIETYFLNALKSAFPTGATLGTGPSAPPSNAQLPFIEMVASRLSFVPEKPNAEEGEAPERAAVFDTQIQQFAADGAIRDFAIPDNLQGEIVEVQSPPGQLVTRGNDYFIEGKRVRFYKPPAPAAIAVIARIRGERVRGYQQRFTGRADAFVRVWAKDRAVADTLSRTVMSTVLVAAENIGILEVPSEKTPGATLRLLRATAAVAAIRRNFEASSHNVTLDLVLQGELEQNVVLGAPEQEGVIREVRQAEP